MPSAPSLILVFLAGNLTVITPCILPILPAMLSGSIGGRLRPLLIVAGMSITFTLMGLLISVIGSAFLGFTEYLKWFSIFFIIAMGAIFFDDEINEEYVKISSMMINSLRNRVAFLKLNNPSWAREEGLVGGLFLGISLGILWIPCVGPILGAVLLYVAAAGPGNLLYGSTLLLTYSMGVGIPMLFIAYSGKKISSKSSWLIQKGPVLKKLSGLILIMVGLMLLFGVDKYIKAALLPYFPAIL